MRKLIALMISIFTASAFAGIASVQGYGSMASFYQFTHDEPTNTGDYHDGRNASQNWLAAQTIKLLVGAECDVWVSNYVNSWYADIPALDGNVFNMDEVKYGAWQLNGDKTWEGNGQTTVVTYKDDASGAENSTTAYYLGHFEGGEEIAMWMTALDQEGGETVDTMQAVYDADHGTTLASRLDGTHDLAGNVRINFGFTTIPSGEGREYVAFGVHEPKASSGQPLPGSFASISIAIASIALAGVRKMKRQ